MWRLFSSIFHCKSCLSFKVQSQLYVPMPSVACQLCTASGHCRSRSCTWHKVLQSPKDVSKLVAENAMNHDFLNPKKKQRWYMYKQMLKNPWLTNRFWHFDILGISLRPCPSTTWRWSPPAAAGCVGPWRWPPSAAAAPHRASRQPSCGPLHSAFTSQ